jgi:riboflavin kinase/FMN adenylyltransferase
MKVYRHLNELDNFRNAVVTIGTFDGVHKGHQTIIRAIIDKAKKKGGESVIITFHPHPRHIIDPDQHLAQLTSIEEKLHLLEKLGVDNVVVVPFSREFSEMSAEAYIEEFLIGQFRPACIVIGYDHRFGNNRTGDIHMLKAHAAQHAIEVDEITEQVINDITISSTKIRKFLLAGKIEPANELLGYPYSFRGLVVKGDAIGRQLGYPTANLFPDHRNKLVPGNGIFAVRVQVATATAWLPGMMSIGERPTFDGKDKRIEVHIFDYSGDLYGEMLRVEMVAFTRAQEKFESKDALMQAMAEDERECRQLLARYTGSDNSAT